jgi:glycosyltransferase involved in cell wall biosynthesis
MLIVNPMGADGWGGVERWFMDVALGLRERGHHITSAGRPDSVWLQRSRDVGFPSLEVPMRSDFHLGRARRLAAFMQEHRVDVVATKLHRGIRVSGLAARLAGRPPVVAFMGLVESKPGLKYRMTYRLFMDAVVTLSRRMREQIIDAGSLDPGTVRAIPYGVVPEKYVAPAGKREQTRAELGLPADAPVALAIGRLNDQKRFDLLLECFAEVRKDVPDAHLVIAGTGKLQPRLTDQRDRLGLQDCAHLVGFRRDVPGLLAAADTLVMSSDDEGLPMVVLESMAAARPAVTTTVGSIDEQIVEGETGYMVARRDMAALRERLSHMLGDLDRARAMGEAARRRVEEHFPLDLCVRRTEAYLSELRDARSGGTPRAR